MQIYIRISSQSVLITAAFALCDDQREARARGGVPIVASAAIQSHWGWEIGGAPVTRRYGVALCFRKSAPRRRRRRCRKRNFAQSHLHLPDDSVIVSPPFPSKTLSTPSKPIHRALLLRQLLRVLNQGIVGPGPVRGLFGTPRRGWREKRDRRSRPDANALRRERRFAFRARGVAERPP